MSAVDIVVKEVERGLTVLRERAQAIVVHDANEYQQACQVALDCRAYVKDVGFKLDPGINSALVHLNFLRNEKNRFIEPAKQIAEIAAQKAEAWKAEERRKAQVEQDRINEQRRIEAQRKAEEEKRAADAQAKLDREARERELETARKAGDIGKREEARLKKQAEEDEARQRELAAKQAVVTAANIQEVKIIPSVPKVAGIKARVNYKFEIVNPGLVKDGFLKPDEVAIGVKVRGDKDPDKSMLEIGGIRVWSEDGI
jgi:hypothetical protein